MTAPRFFVPSLDAGRVVIEGDDAKHARALRIGPGELITVSDGRGRVAAATVISSDRTLVAELGSLDTVARPRPSLVVAQGIPKQAKFEQIVQDLVEIGVMRIVPLATARSIPRWDRNKMLDRLERWRAVAFSAAMQSRRAWLPEVAPMMGIADAPAGAFVLHEEAPSRLGEVLPPEAPDELVLAVGPEGGFAPEEVAEMEKRRCVPASLGRTVLRTETAALVGASLILGRYGVLG